MDKLNEQIISRESQVEIDSEVKNMIEDIVIDWINKYPLEEGNLAINNINDPEQIKYWVNGVWGRITQQLSGSGLPYDNRAILSVAFKNFISQIEDHKFYGKIKPYLPKMNINI